MLDTRRKALLLLSLIIALTAPRVDNPPASPATALTRDTSIPPTAWPRSGDGSLSFEANRGQADSRVSFLSRGPGYMLYLTPNGAILALTAPRTRAARPVPMAGPWPLDGSASRQQAAPAVFRLGFARASARPRVVGMERLSATVNYFMGKDPRRWRAGIPTYAAVAYRDLYPGVSLVYHGARGALEYDLVLAPGARPDAIALVVDGAQRPRTDGQGNLVLAGPGGAALVWAKPVAYQVVRGRRRMVAVRYVLGGAGQVGFRIGAYDAHAPLIVDPVLRVPAGGGGMVGPRGLRYSTYLGGNDVDMGRGIAVDLVGNAYVTGYTRSANFPLAHAQQGMSGGDYDAFVTKLDRGGRLVYSTYLGGSGLDLGLGIAVDGAGDAYVTGDTTSTNLPTLHAFQAAYGGGSLDAFVAKLDTQGALMYSTYVGGKAQDYGLGIAVDGLDDAYVTGHTSSVDFPTRDRDALQPAFGGGHGPGAIGGVTAGDAFVLKLNPSGDGLIYSTYLGGRDDEQGNGIAVDAAGGAYVAGATASANFPLRHAARHLYGGGPSDAFVVKLTPAGDALEYSTYLSGHGADFGNSIAVDSTGNAYVAGYTASVDFPTSDALQASYAGGSSAATSGDAFVTKLNAAGNGFLYSTYLGGNSLDVAYSIAIDNVGNAYVTGFTDSPRFPTRHAVQARYAGSRAQPGDAFVSILNPIGSSLVFGTYLGGRDQDYGSGIAANGAGSAYITGFTDSPNFPLAHALQSHDGAGHSSANGDAFVTKIGIGRPSASVHISGSAATAQVLGPGTRTGATFGHGQT